MSQPTLITPHAGELSKLLATRGVNVSAEVIESDPLTWAAQASRHLDVTVLLKGSRTVVAYGETVIALPRSTSWLATAGTGDVLAGIVGALVATNYIEILNSPTRLAEVAATAAFIHNNAALLASRGGPISASQITTEIQSAIRAILK